MDSKTETVSDMKTEEEKHTLQYPSKPRGGIYGDEVYDQWLKLLMHVKDFIPNDSVSGSIKGTSSMMRARAKTIELSAKSLYEICKASLPDRK